MLRAIFGVNLATQPESSSSNSPQQKDALITEVQLPPCLEDSIKDSDNVGFYQSYFEEFQQEISRSFEEIRKTDETKESKRFALSVQLYLHISTRTYLYLFIIIYLSCIY